MDHVAELSFKRSSSHDPPNQNIHRTSARRRHAPRATAISFPMLLFAFIEFSDHIHSATIVENQLVRAAGGVPGPPGENDQSGQNEQDGGNGKSGQNTPQKVGQKPAPVTPAASIISVATAAPPQTQPASTIAPQPQISKPSLAISSKSVLAPTTLSTPSSSAGTQTAPLAVTVTPTSSSNPPGMASLSLPTIATSSTIDPISTISTASTTSTESFFSLVPSASSSSSLFTILPPIGPSTSPTETAATSVPTNIVSAPQSPSTENRNLAITLPIVLVTLLAALIISLLLTRCCTRRPHLAFPHISYLGLRTRNSLPIPDEETPPSAVEKRRTVLTASTASVPTSQQTDVGASVFMARFFSLTRHLPRAPTPEPQLGLPFPRTSWVSPVVQRQESQGQQQSQPQHQHQNQQQQQNQQQKQQSFFGLTLPRSRPPRSRPPPLPPLARLSPSQSPLTQHPLNTSIATTTTTSTAVSLSVPAPVMTFMPPLPEVPRYVAFLSPRASNASLAVSSPTSDGLSSRNGSEGLPLAVVRMGGRDSDDDVEYGDEKEEKGEYYDGAVRSRAPARFTFGGGDGCKGGEGGEVEGGVGRTVGRAWSGFGE